MNVMSINAAHPLSVFAHEFGHAFANFAEEYTPASIPFGSKNCQANCDKFNIQDQCFEGCSKNDYFRSIENGLMRTLSSETFGEFDESIILDKISKKIGKSNIPTIGKVTATQDQCSEQNYYLINANYSANSIIVNQKSVEQGCVNSNGAGPFNYQIILEDNSTINQGEFNPELIFTDTQLTNQEIISGEAYLSDIPFILKIPIIENSKSLQISQDNQIIAEINLKTIGAEPCQIN